MQGLNNMKRYVVRLKDYTKCTMNDLEIGDVYSLHKDGEMIAEGLLVVGKPDVIVKNFFTVVPTKKIF